MVSRRPNELEKVPELHSLHVELLVAPEALEYAPGKQRAQSKRLVSPVALE